MIDEWEVIYYTMKSSVKLGVVYRHKKSLHT